MKITLELEKIKPTELIPPVAFHSINNGQVINPILNSSTVGMTPGEFSKDRIFYKVKKVVEIKK